MKDSAIPPRLRLDAARMIMLVEGYDLRKLRLANEANVDPEERDAVENVSDIRALVEKQQGVQ